jgi:hypothetical protein
MEDAQADQNGAKTAATPRTVAVFQAMKSRSKSSWIALCLALRLFSALDTVISRATFRITVESSPTLP